MEERFNFNVILNSFVFIIPINIVVLVFLAVYRFFFFVYFADFSAISSLKLYVLKAFWMGFRFDLSVVAYINAPITLLFLICLLLKSYPFFKKIISFIKYYYFAIFTLMFLAIFVDLAFYAYFKDHYNLMIFGFFEDDTFALIKTILCDYRFYGLVIAFVILTLFIFNLSKWTYKELKYNERFFNTLYWKPFKKFAVIFLILALNFIFARGSFSMFPLGLFYSQISPNQFINKLCVNPIHPLADTIYLKIKNANNSIDLKEVFKYKNQEEVINDLTVLSKYNNATDIKDIFYKTTKENNALQTIKPNVILIVMEGFGEMPVINNSEKFDVLGELKQHFSKDIVFNNFLAAGFITIHAIESMTLGIPQRPYVNQITQTQDAFCQFASSMVLPYKNAGYRSTAIYGGSMTWRDLEGFFKVQGFDETIGEGNVHVEADDRHSWGINDDKLYELLEKQLFDEDIKEPQFIYAITTQTHPPYKVPGDYQSLPLEIPLSIQKMMSSKDLKNKNLFKVYQYANNQLAKFITDIKKSKFADNTIIAVTGDHNLRELSNYVPEESFVRYAVPFYLYIPQQIKESLNIQKVNTDICGSHIDIMPTLYNLSLSSKEYVSAGNNLLDCDDNIAFNTDGVVLRNDIAIKYNFVDDSIQSFSFDNKNKMLSVTEETQEHISLKKYYKAIMTISDIFVKNNTL
ncbi:MAG: sulfatase-like hydrolase/transferase [Elusimicrobia bacterium]|nr:sulfatase-like hydrolase/transferase [Elusimicrobiota bacterium]